MHHSYGIVHIIGYIFSQGEKSCDVEIIEIHCSNESTYSVSIDKQCFLNLITVLMFGL
jgi:hypothetical protein